MKKLIIISIFSFIVFSCQNTEKEYNLSDIVINEEIYYKKFSDEIINGKIFSYSIPDSVKVYHGNIRNGKKQGKWVFFREDNGQIDFIQNYKDGLLHGPYISYFKGNKEFEDNYVNGVEHGKSFQYYESGEIFSECFINQGKLDGECIGYYKSGKILNRENYKDDNPDGEYIEYFENGNVNIKINFKFDTYLLVIGKVISYYENGKIYCEEDHKDGKLTEVYGKCFEYDENGDILKEHITLNTGRMEPLDGEVIKTIEYK